MPNLTQPLDEIVKQEYDSIVNKAILRTTLLQEKSFLSKPDTRQAEVLEYENEHYNNPESPLYQDDGAAVMWATLKGIKGATFQALRAQDITAVRGVVLVPQNHLGFEWYKELPLVPMICVHQRRAAFRDATGAKWHLPYITSLNVRPATVQEIRDVVTGIFAVRPMQFIKNMGDSLVGVDLGGDTGDSDDS